MKKNRPVVVWNKRASAFFRKAYEYIKADSNSNAEKVKAGITKVVDGLPDHPEKYPPDKFKKNNPATTEHLRSIPLGLLIGTPREKSKY